MGARDHGMLADIDSGFQAGRDGWPRTLDGRREREALPAEREAVAFEGLHRRAAGIFAEAKAELDWRIRRVENFRVRARREREAPRHSRFRGGAKRSRGK